MCESVTLLGGKCLIRNALHLCTTELRMQRYTLFLQLTPVCMHEYMYVEANYIAGLDSAISM
jgi:hypothetical protein